MSDEAKVPNLPTYEKPSERKPATLPDSISSIKPPSSLNKVIAKMLMPKIKSLKSLKSPKIKTPKIKKPKKLKVS